jgi:general secretion pathway protein L
MTNVTLSGWRAPVWGFLAWWGAELAGLLPAALRRLPQGTDRILIALDEPDVVVSLASGRSHAVLGRVGLDPASAERLHSFLAEHEAARELPVYVRLPASAALSATIELPLVAETNLGEVIAFELDRHTPFRAEEVYFSHRLLERRPEAQRLVIELRLVPRPVVESALAAVAALGLRADRVEVARGPSEDADADLLLAELSKGRWGRVRLANRVLALAAVALLCAIVAVPLITTHIQAAALSREFSAARAGMATMSRLQGEIAGLRRDDDFLVQLKRQRPPLSQVLDETTRVLPDNTWLSEFQVEGREVRLSGCTAAASALIGLLERSSMFRETHFANSVTRDVAQDCERFGITARIISPRSP